MGSTGQFFMRWLQSKLGNTAKERAILEEVDNWLAANKADKSSIDPNSGNNLPPFLYQNTN